MKNAWMCLKIKAKYAIIGDARKVIRRLSKVYPQIYADLSTAKNVANQGLEWVIPSLHSPYYDYDIYIFSY